MRIARRDALGRLLHGAAWAQMPAPFVSGNDVRFYHVQIAAVPTKCAEGDGGRGTKSNCASPVIALDC